MHFDDRLATVLRARAGGPATARIQYRQLLDLLGTMPVEARGKQVGMACDRIGELGQAIPAHERAAMLREPGLRLRNPRLVALLANSEPAVAAAAIEQAQLAENEWIDLAPALPAQARGMVSQRRDLGTRADALFGRLGMAAPGLPPVAEVQSGTVIHLEEVAAPLARPSESAMPSEPAKAIEPDKPGGIAAIVQRIEDFRKTREPGEGQAGGKDAALGEHAAERQAPHPRAFDFATDSQGGIVWSDPGMAPMAVGLRLASTEMAGLPGPKKALARAFRQHQPIRAMPCELSGAPAIMGRWLVDAAPNFDPLSGAYTGHSGRMRRPLVSDMAMPAPPEPSGEADRLRQLLHELRTPVNAIQGFAEVIQQQLFGPTPHEYRALASAIVGDAAHLLAGFDELERLARLEGGTLPLAQGSADLAAIVRATAEQLRPFTDPRSSGFSLDNSCDAPLIAALGKDDAERLIWRLLATLASRAGPGEVLALHCGQAAGQVRMTLQLPAGLAEMDENQLMQATAGGSPRAVTAGMFGTGFSLRLAAAEAKAAGGMLQHVGKALDLRLPGLTAAQGGHSEGPGKRSVT